MKTILRCAVVSAVIAIVFSFFSITISTASLDLPADFDAGEDSATQWVQTQQQTSG